MRSYWYTYAVVNVDRKTVAPRMGVTKMTKDEPRRPLEGIRVVDLSRVLAGPYCTMILGDLGAEVIKVEMPGEGDDTRKWGPPFIEGESSYFLSINRSKKSITVNLKHPEGKRILEKLIKNSDVLVENFRPGTIDKLGFGWEHVSKINPAIVMASISGFGQTGPYAQKPGYDVLAQALSGMMSITGEANGPPVKVGVPVADIGAGMWAAVGILAALIARRWTGKGQYVDVSLLDGQMAWMTFMAGIYFATGKSPGRLGTAHPTIVPYQAFRCRDGKYVIVAVGSESLWKKFVGIVDEFDTSIGRDPKFATNADRVTHREEAVSRLSLVFEKKDSSWWVSRLEGEGIPAGVINDLAAACEDPHVKARGMILEFDHPKAGSIKVTGNPVKLSECPGEPSVRPPLLGEHTEEVLASLGYQKEEIEELRRMEAI